MHLNGVGPKNAARLKKLNLHTLFDLLLHLPLRYEDRTQITALRELKIGTAAAIVGTITHVTVIWQRRPRLLCKLNDATGYLYLYFFNFTKQKLQFTLKPGMRLYCYGEVSWAQRTYAMIHPEYKILSPLEAPPLATTLTPVYPTTEGLTQTLLRKLVTQALKIATLQQLPDYLPLEMHQQLDLPHLLAALTLLHQPPPDTDHNALSKRSHPMQQRLILEELLAHQVSLLVLRQDAQTHKAPPISWDHNLNMNLQATLPFTLTAAQQRVIQEIASDLAQPRPMLRLLQGDVGCGKTIVAACAILQIVKQGLQAAIMAPTEILAEQHATNINHWLAPYKITTVLLTGKTKGKTRTTILKEIRTAAAQVVVGTHAIFQEKVQFKNLALIIIDEQHRFGVHQKLQLRAKGSGNKQYPHQLVMTATPIPRTLAMSIYADLNCSSIDELPKNRAPITTVIVANQRRAEIIKHIRNHCRQGNQAYWVCPLIAESPTLTWQAAETLAIELTTLLPELKIGLIHGRMQSTQKEEIMHQFKEHHFDLLVATTVIEVGVDVANASLMIIENAERLGLVQLHQLRGRIGRGTVASYCILTYQPPITQTARQRLLLLRANNDGFMLAQKDLELRGAGEVLGVKQTGLLSLRIAELSKDQHLISTVQKSARLLIEKYPTIVPLLIARWLQGKGQYGNII